MEWLPWNDQTNLPCFRFNNLNTEARYSTLWATGVSVGLPHESHRTVRTCQDILSGIKPSESELPNSQRMNTEQELSCHWGGRIRLRIHFLLVHNTNTHLAPFSSYRALLLVNFSLSSGGPLFNAVFLINLRGYPANHTYCRKLDLWAILSSQTVWVWLQLWCNWPQRYWNRWNNAK